MNSKNRVSTFEKFYCTVTPEQDRCAVVGELLFYSPLIDPGNQAVMNNMFGLIKLAVEAVETAPLEAAQFIKDVSGRGLEQRDLPSLWMISSG